jgi:hypothetical protein
MDWAGFKGAAKRIEDVDLPRIGHMIGVGEDKIHAVLDVESEDAVRATHLLPRAVG